MSTLAVIATILYTMVVLSLIGNFIRLFIDSKRLKAEGKTPLVGRTSLTIVVAAIVETLVMFLLLKVVAILGLYNVFSVIITFIALFYIRHISAYLATWGLWSLFVRNDKKKELTKIQQDLQKETMQ